VQQHKGGSARLLARRSSWHWRMATQFPSRVILHIDLDCFYGEPGLLARSGTWLVTGVRAAVLVHRRAASSTQAQPATHAALLPVQVEQQRLGIPADVPTAVQQWEGLIAISYAARARGVTRHMRVAEAKRLCPELRLVHVQTVGGQHGNTGAAGDAAEHAPPAAAAAAAAAPAAAPAAVGAACSSEPAQAAGAGAAEVEGQAADRSKMKASLQRYRRVRVSGKDGKGRFQACKWACP
jgi:hypothetical protein